MPSYLGSILRNTSLNHKTRIQHLRTHLIFWTSSFFSRKTPTPAWHSSPYNLVAGIVYSYFGRHYEIHKWVIFTVASTFSDIKSQQKKNSIFFFLRLIWQFLNSGNTARKDGLAEASTSNIVSAWEMKCTISESSHWQRNVSHLPMRCQTLLSSSSATLNSCLPSSCP